MKYIFSLSVIVIIFSATNSSCKKTVTETVVNIDTFLVRSVDTTFIMNAQNWNCFDYQTLSLLDSGSSTFHTTSEGVKFYGQAFRYGARLQSKSELGFFEKTIYFKWKGAGNGQLAIFVPQIKYDALSNDNTPANQGVDLGLYAVNGSVTGSVSITENTWYYTRVIPIAGTDNYRVVTASGNYNNSGGTVIADTIIPIYTKSGYPGIRIGDPFGGKNSFGIFSEFKIVKD
jgi:hypothetical protein